MIGAALAVGLLWLFFRGTDLAAIRDSVWNANPWFILLAVVATYANYFVRALRWQVLLSPLGRPGLWDCFVYTVIGFMVNVLVPPGRLGEIIRPYLLARKAGFSASSSFATIFLERVLDLGTIVLLVAASILVIPPGRSNVQVMQALKWGGLVGIAGASGLFGVLYLFARFPTRTISWVEHLCRMLPERMGRAVARFTEMFTAGLGVLKDGKSLLKSTILSILLWFCIGTAYWLGARSLGIEFSVMAMFLVIGFLSLGVLVPTPGAVGGYHYMSALALTSLFAIPESLAKAGSLVNHAIAFVPVVLLGLVLFPRAGMSFRQVKTITQPQDEDDET